MSALLMSLMIGCLRGGRVTSTSEQPEGDHLSESTTGTNREQDVRGGAAKVVVPGSLAWLAAGTLISVGLIGFFTGLILVLFGLALLVWAFDRKVPDMPAFLVGLGVGPLLLFRDEWQRYKKSGCIPDTSTGMNQGPDCMGVYVWGYRLGLWLVVLGVVLLIAARVRRSWRRDVGRRPRPDSNMGGLLKLALASQLALAAAFVVSSCDDTRYTTPTVDTRYVQVDISTDTAGTVLIPNDWPHVSHPGHNAELGLAAASREALVDEVVDGNAAHSISADQDLRPDDVFVEVWASYQPFVGIRKIGLLPKRFAPELFAPDESLLGSQVYELKARGEGIYDIRYWIGPDASEEDREALFAVIRSMRFA